ncbi:hypothetical protein LEP1GSC079_0302 [Leptospira interrogans str. FPW1039]|uniref:Uncharacterized protein n=1 Tax=Leptospira interrogans str. FPW1039 TaxID=1193040 RepID=A0A0F6IKT1_LEPIR|nr:hypothetical protein LEP1GSC079_0302 [Leptospira interrogans str. FPW1039]
MLVDWNRLDSLKQGDDEEEAAWLREMVESLLTNMEVRVNNIAHFTKKKKTLNFKLNFIKPKVFLLISDWKT